MSAQGIALGLRRVIPKSPVGAQQTCVEQRGWSPGAPGPPSGLPRNPWRETRSEKTAPAGRRRHRPNAMHPSVTSDRLHLDRAEVSLHVARTGVTNADTTAMNNVTSQSAIRRGVLRRRSVRHSIRRDRREQKKMRRTNPFESTSATLNFASRKRSGIRIDREPARYPARPNHDTNLVDRHGNVRTDQRSGQMQNRRATGKYARYRCLPVLSRCEPTPHDHPYRPHSNRDQRAPSLEQAESTMAVRSVGRFVCAR